MWAKRVAYEGTPHNCDTANSTHSFDDIMAVIVKILRLMGIPLDPYGIDSTILRYWSISFGVTMLLFDVGTNCKLFVSLLLSNDNLTKNMNTANLSLIIHVGNSVLSLVTLHVGLLVSTSLNWKGLMNSFRQIDKLHIFEKEDYDQLKNIVRKAIVPFISMACLPFLYFIQNSLPTNFKINHLFLDSVD